MQQHAGTFFEQAEGEAGTDMPRFVKVEFDALRECGVLTHGFLHLLCGDCGQDKRIAFFCKQRGSCPPCGAHCLVQTATTRPSGSRRRFPKPTWVPATAPTPIGSA